MRTAKRLHLYIVMLTDAPLGWQRDYVDTNIVTSRYDREAVLQSLSAHGLGRPVDAVMTYDERTVTLTASIAEAFQVARNSYHAAYAARNKFAMRTRFESYGLPCPRFGLAHSTAEAEELVKKAVGFPAVIKPLFGSASRGVHRVENFEELRRAFPIAMQIGSTFLPPGDDDGEHRAVILEEYLDGGEVAVDGVLSRGEVTWIGIFDKPNRLEGPTFEETIYITPSAYPREIQEDILANVGRGLKALGLTCGAFHAEVRMTRRGPRLLEIAARPIGGVCARAYTYSRGLDYHEIVLRAVLDDPVEIPSVHCTPSGVMMLPAPGNGRLVRVCGIEAARRIQGVQDVLIITKPGAVIRRFPDQEHYTGFILATGATNEEVELNLNLSHAQLKFELEPIHEETQCS